MPEDSNNTAVEAESSGFGQIFEVADLPWWVAHVRPRCEKKLVEYCTREECLSTLPCYHAAHKYRGKTVTFEKPLFPGYVFLRFSPQLRQKVYQSDHVANLLEVYDQDLFARQLKDVYRALETKLEIRVAPEIGKGKRVAIIRGPLRGTEGWVEERYGMTTVLLRIDFIGQAAAVKVDAEDLELI
jgi:transcription antitermination factor NusG